MSVSRALLLPILLAAALPASAAAQLAPPSSGGLVALEHALTALGSQKRVLLIGAHPDDEDTELLTLMVRGSGAEAAYLSLTRGEGGQNLIGPELGEALGLLRTEELLAARRIDGARQFFTRAYDFGFSKTLTDTWQHWPRDSVLKDVVRVVRRFRPQVIVTIFSGTPADGHGQHQAAGWAAREAWRVAGDSGAFPELARDEGLAPWRPLKLYQSSRFSPGSATLTLSSGELDRATGQSYHQIAMRSRSQHRSQDMGQLQRMGPSEVYLNLIEDRTGAGRGGVFAGVDTTFQSLVRRDWPAEARRHAGTLLARYRARVDSAKHLPRPDSLDAIASMLLRGWSDLLGFLDVSGRGTTGGLTIPPAIYDQGRHLATAVAAARGLVFDVVTDRAVGVPGEPLTATLALWNASPRPVRVAAFPLQTIGTLPEPAVAAGDMTVAPGTVESVTVTINPRRAAVDPYFLAQPKDGDLYRWTGYDAPKDRGVFGTYGLPFEAPSLQGTFTLMGDSVSLTFHREAAFRSRDQAVGEVRVPVAVYPRLDVKLDPDHLVLPAAVRTTHPVTVTIINNGTRPARGLVRLELPAGWPAVAPRRFNLGGGGAEVALTLDLGVPEGVTTGDFRIRAVAEDADGERYDRGVFTVAYPHIHSRAYTRPAIAEVRVAPLTVPNLGPIAYIRGAADRVPEALRSVGMTIDVLAPADLATADLSRYAAVVIGSRAYEVDTALTRHNDRILSYARAGGLVVVQYQQYQFFDGGYAPFPLSVGGRPLVPNGVTSPGTSGPGSTHDRVTDENADVRILENADPVVVGPNRLRPADWDGWVQERGLYFARSWDSTYHTLLEMHDPGEGPLRGGLLIAPTGEGTYVYTGLSFFRQLPAGVPGAFRLFLNLLALSSKRGVS